LPCATLLLRPRLGFIIAVQIWAMAAVDNRCYVRLAEAIRSNFQK
jgi:hypothetical protein